MKHWKMPSTISLIGICANADRFFFSNPKSDNAAQYPAERHGVNVAGMYKLFWTLFHRVCCFEP